MHTAAKDKEQVGALIVLLETSQKDQLDMEGANLRHASLHNLIVGRFRDGWLLRMPSTNQDTRKLEEQEINKSRIQEIRTPLNQGIRESGDQAIRRYIHLAVR